MLRVVETYCMRNQEALIAVIITKSFVLNYDISFSHQSLTYLQPQSLGHHAYVDADKRHSIWPIGFCHDESTTVQPGKEASCILATFAVAHLKRKRGEWATSPHSPATRKQPQSHEKRVLRKDKQSTWHCSSKWDNICVFKNKANIIKEALFFYVEKCKSKVVIGSAETIHWPVAKEGAGLAQNFITTLETFQGFSVFWNKNFSPT